MPRKFLYQHISLRTLSLAFQFIVNILFARSFGAETTGQVFYLVAVNAFIIQIAGFSLESGIGYSAAAHNTHTRTLAKFSLLWTLVATLAGTVFHLLFTGTTHEHEIPILYSLYFIAGNLLIAFGNAIYFAKLKFFLPNILSVFVNLALIVLLISLPSVQQSFPWFDFIGAYFGSFMLHGILLFVFLPTSPDYGSVSAEPSELKEIFRYSTKAFIANLLFLGITRIDYVFINYFRDASELGNYIQVSKIAHMFFIVPSMISAVLFPVFARHANSASTTEVRKISGGLVLLYVVACGILAATGRYIFPLVYGDSFDQMYIPFLLLIPGILAMSALYPYTAFFAAKDRIGINIRGTLAAFLFIVVADAIFIRIYGITAAAAITSIGYVIYYFYVVRVFHKQPQVL